MKYIYTTLLLFFTAFCFSQLILNTRETTSRTVFDPNAIYLLPRFSADAADVTLFIVKIQKASNLNIRYCDYLLGNYLVVTVTCGKIKKTTKIVK